MSQSFGDVPLWPRGQRGRDVPGQRVLVPGSRHGDRPRGLVLGSGGAGRHRSPDQPPRRVRAEMPSAPEPGEMRPGSGVAFTLDHAVVLPLAHTQGRTRAACSCAPADSAAPRQRAEPHRPAPAALGPSGAGGQDSRAAGAVPHPPAQNLLLLPSVGSFGGAGAARSAPGELRAGQKVFRYCSRPFPGKTSGPSGARRKGGCPRALWCGASPLSSACWVEEPITARLAAAGLWCQPGHSSAGWGSHLKYFSVLFYSLRATARADQVAAHLFQASALEQLKADTSEG